MEKKQKTYMATGAIQLDTYALVDGQKVLIEFRGGSLDLRRNGIFQTSDQKVIAALDADIARVGAARCSFKVIHEETLIEDDPEGTITEPLEEKIIPDVTTVTAAKKWLLDASGKGLIKKGVTASMIPNRTAVFKIAEENNVKFPNLPTEDQFQVGGEKKTADEANTNAQE
jgi:hypothetical protein